MALYLYKQNRSINISPLEIVDEVSLAGHNVIYNQWKKKGEPRNEGWQINSNDLENELQNLVDADYRSLVLIDYDPSGKEEVVLLQVKDIYAYTYASKDTGEVWWTPIMLRMQKVFGRELQNELSDKQRKDLISNFNAEYQEEVIEFLYLQGEKRGWNWGMVGRVNGALIPPEAREYFLPFFRPKA